MKAAVLCATLGAAPKGATAGVDAFVTASSNGSRCVVSCTVAFSLYK